jgi:hypothetical protein
MHVLAKGAARASGINSKFFEFAFERENKVRPFFYVVDEAHRFITAARR